MRPNPHLYEANARIFLRRMTGKYRRSLTISTIPEEEWQELNHLGINFLWFMGVWQRSRVSRKKALLDPALRHAYDQALPGWTDDDIAGSPYAVYSYNLDPSLGKSRELIQLKQKLNRHGLRLMLDFVPNHLACDHPWVSSHSNWFVQGKSTNVRNHPDWFFSPKKGVYLAHGRDPNFPPWTDTVQINFYSIDAQGALIDELLRIAEVADGVRCDMAMLVLNDVFGNIWGDVVADNSRAEHEFWAEAIRQVKQRKPDFLFLAEAYWGFEKRLQELGFDFTYGKQLYDKLRFSNIDEIRRYLESETLSLKRSAHFIENHDEPRAITAFGYERSQAAAVITSTIPGLRVFHDGQFTGRRIHLPVQMIREPEELPDSNIMQFYKHLLAICTEPAFHEGEWKLMELNHAWEGNESYQNLLAWSWHNATETKIVIVNYSPNPAQGRLKVPLPDANIARMLFHDELTSTTYVRDPDEVSNQGLYIALEPYHAHLFNMMTG